MTHRYHLVSLSIIGALAGSALAAPADDPFVAGNRAAAAGDHRAAAADFERALVVHGWSPGTLLDLGNAYAGAGERGRAILAYERAQLLAPRDAAIAANLAQVREAAGVTAPVPSSAERVLGKLTADEWTWFALGSSALACIGLVGLGWSVRRPASRALAICGAIATTLAGAAALYIAPSSARAVIVTGEVARIAPFSTAESAFTAPAGETVRIEQRRDEYVYVRDGERTGWLPRAAVEQVVVGQPAVPSA